MFLTEEEAKLLVQLRLYAEPEGATLSEAQLQEVLDWAEDVKMKAAVLDNMLAGEVLPLGLTRPGDLGSMGLRLTEKGKAKGAELARQLGVL